MSDSFSANESQRLPESLFVENDTDHLINVEVLCLRLGTNVSTGLSVKKAKENLRKEGLNTLSRPNTKPKENSMFKKLMRGRMERSSRWSKQEWNDVFLSRLHQDYTVIRDSIKRKIHGSELVIGDVVFLYRHQTVPADMRIVMAHDLLVDNRIITGEPEESKSERPTSSDALLSENMLYAGTQILHGYCCAVVLKKGNDTIYATLAQFAQKVKYVRSRSLSRSSSLLSESSISSSRHSMVSSSSSLSASPPPSPPSSLHGVFDEI